MLQNSHVFRVQYEWELTGSEAFEVSPPAGVVEGLSSSEVLVQWQYTPPPTAMTGSTKRGGMKSLGGEESKGVVDVGVVEG